MLRPKNAIVSVWAMVLFIACAALGQTPSAAPAASAKPTFDVATVRPSPPMDMGKVQAEIQAGRMPKFGPQVDASHAEYTFMSLKDLIALAYDVKAYQITGPDWMATERFDIVAKMPEGASKDDAPAMLQSSAGGPLQAQSPPRHRGTSRDRRWWSAKVGQS